MSQKYPYTLPSLEYAYDALEPHIDARTMEVHYTKHHQAYIDGLNKALEKYPEELQQKTVESLLSDLTLVPEAIRTDIRNHGGGHYNHTLFWQFMTPKSAGKPQGNLAQEIIKTFGSFEQFQEKFNAAARTRFGSGWAWLALNKTGDLVVTSTANQDSPVSDGFKPLLGLDVWEHAYYLKYQNRRVDYIQAWWHVVNWEFAEQLYK